MIIACPACATRYVVPDTSIGAEGRMVRCAKCRHSWFQEGPDLPATPARKAVSETPAPREAPQAAPAAAPRPVPAPPQPPQPDPAPASAETRRRFVTTEPDSDAPPPVEETIPPPPVMTREAPEQDLPGSSHFDAAPPFRRRRNPLKLWTWAAATFALLALGATIAVSYFGLPDWVPISRPTFAAAQPELELDFPPDQQERRQLPNGTEFFGASGSITNSGSEARNVPPILIVLRDGRDRIVYSWEVTPPKRTLAPGETISVNEAVTDVPRSARFAEIGWKPD